MAKSKNKKTKENVRHPFLLNWDEITNQETDKKPVKGKLNNTRHVQNKKGQDSKKSRNLDKVRNIGTIRQEILKSLLLATLILVLELVIYFTLQA